MKTEMSLFATFHPAIPVETIRNETGHLKDTSELTVTDKSTYAGSVLLRYC